MEPSFSSNGDIEETLEAWDSKIKIDAKEVKSKFEEFKTKKLPKYQKKFKKYMRRIEDAFIRLGIKDETLLSLKDEITGVKLGENSFTYSRILLYLFNIATFIKYSYETQKCDKKSFKEVFKITQRCFKYVRAIINLNYINFNQEEIESFDNQRRNFRQIHKEQKKERIIPMISEEDYLDLDKPRTPSLKKETSTRISLPFNPKHMKKMKSDHPETEEDAVRKRLGEIAKEIRGFYDSQSHQEHLQKKIHGSWM